MIRQPSECRCFGGSCWPEFCPVRNLKRKVELQERHYRVPTGGILTLTRSLKQVEKDKEEKEDE